MLDEWENLLSSIRSEAITAGNCPRRVDRAFSIVAKGQLGRVVSAYGTSAHACGCADNRFRRSRKCKHQLALIVTRRLQAHLEAGMERQQPQGALRAPESA